MPQEQKPKQASVGPFNYLKQLFTGGSLPEMYENEYPELAQRWASAQIEMPNEAAKVNRVRPMSMLEKAFYPDAYAKTSPFGNILLNQDMITGHNADLGDVLAHELTHVGQGKSGFFRKYTNPDAVEQEAINKEAMRPVRRGDIFLRGK